MTVSLCGSNMFRKVTSYCIYAQGYTGENSLYERTWIGLHGAIHCQKLTTIASGIGSLKQ